MSCRPWEEPTPVSEPPHPVTPTKPSGNDGASRADPYAADPYRLSDEEEGVGAKKIRPPRHVLQYEVVKRWVTGERAIMSNEQIRAELEEIMYAHMEMSGQRKFFGHKTLPTDLGSWKLGRKHTDKYCIRYDVYRCPMRHRCECKISMRVVTGPDFLELQRCGLHDKNSHDNDQSKTLTYAEINSVVEAVKTAPTMPGSEIRRNLLDHDSPTKKSSRSSSQGRSAPKARRPASQPVPPPSAVKVRKLPNFSAKRVK